MSRLSTEIITEFFVLTWLNAIGLWIFYNSNIMPDVLFAYPRVEDLDHS
jgi:hypothetical protein